MFTPNKMCSNKWNKKRKDTSLFQFLDLVFTKFPLILLLYLEEGIRKMLLCGSEVFMTGRMGRTAIAPSSIPQYSKNNSSLLSRCQTLVCKVPQVLFKFLQNKSSRVEHSADLTVENKVTGVATPPQISSAQEISQQVERKVNSHLSPEAQCKAKKNIFLRARNCEFINLKIQSLEAKMA
uniref:Uncharacterized protein n=1 Tax=Timema bartmani TaxID=61472 RepID=A0A7R9F283_9NEOP|nr:unnamed protein product [Timema bartmani]